MVRDLNGSSLEACLVSFTGVVIDYPGQVAEHHNNTEQVPYNPKLSRRGMILDKDDEGSTKLGYDPSLKPEMAKTKSKLQQRPRRSSQPIPIEKNRPSPQELEREAMSAESYLQYDMATWRMHNRITIARRLRAYSLSRSEDCHAATARHELVQYYYQHRLAQKHSEVNVTIGKKISK